MLIYTQNSSKQKKIKDMDKLHQAIRNLEIEKVKSSLKGEVDLKGTMLSVCSSQSEDFETQLDLIKMLLKKGANVNEKDKNGVSPLHRAVRFRSPKVVEFLIKKGADIDYADKRNASTPLHKAVVNSGAPSTKGKGKEAIEIIKILLDNGANPNLKNKKGKLPIDYVKKDAIKKLFETRK